MLKVVSLILKAIQPLFSPKTIIAISVGSFVAGLIVAVNYQHVILKISEIAQAISLRVISRGGNRYFF